MSDAEKRVVIPLGEQSKAHVLSRLAASPAFIPLGGEPGFILLGSESSVYPAWR